MNTEDISSLLEERLPKKSSEETEGKKHAEILRIDNSEIEEYKDNKSADVNWISANLRNFGHRRPKHRPNTISSNKEGEAQSCSYFADSKPHHYPLRSSRINGASN